MSLSKVFAQGTGKVVIIDDLYLQPDPEAVSGESLAALLRALRLAPDDCSSLALVLDVAGITDAAQLVDAANADLKTVYAAYLGGGHAYLEPLFSDLDEKQIAGLRRLRMLESEVLKFFKVRPSTFGGLESARNELADAALVFVDFFLEGVTNHDEARRHHSAVKTELAAKFSIGEQHFPKVVVLMSTALPGPSELAGFRKDTGIRGAFFHSLDKTTFSPDELQCRFSEYVEAYESADKLNGYLEKIESEIRSAADSLAGDLRSRLDVHDLTILKTLRLDGESDTPQAYLTFLLSEVLAARVRMAPGLQSEVLPKEHTYGDAPFDGKLLPSSVLFELFADIAVAPAPRGGDLKVAFGDVIEEIEGEKKGHLYLAISPACDLQRCAIDYEVLCVPGITVESSKSLAGLFERKYSFGQGDIVLKTTDIVGTVSYSKISFDTKGLKTFGISTIQDSKRFRRLARLTEVFSQEVKTLALNHASRVGVPIDPSFSLGLKAKVRFNLVGDKQGDDKIQGEYEIDDSMFMPAVLAMGRELQDRELHPTVMFSAQFKEWLQTMIANKLTEQIAKNGGVSKLNAIQAHFSKPESFKISFDGGANSKSVSSLISIKYFLTLPQVGDVRNFEIIFYSELQDDKGQAADVDIAMAS